MASAEPESDRSQTEPEIDMSVKDPEFTEYWAYYLTAPQQLALLHLRRVGSENRNGSLEGINPSTLKALKERGLVDYEVPTWSNISSAQNIRLTERGKRAVAGRV